MFIADTATGTIRVIPAAVASCLISHDTIIQLAGSWDREGLLWVLATNPDNGYCQLGSWTGTGPLHTFAPARTARGAVGSWTGLAV